MSPLVLYDANHGTWVLGPGAFEEQYALVTFQGIVREAIEIESFDTTRPPSTPASSRSGRG